MKKGKWNMYDIIQKDKKQNNVYKIDKGVFFCSPENMKDDSLKVLISHKILVSLDKDMEKMAGLMVQSIMEGLLDGGK